MFICEHTVQTFSCKSTSFSSTKFGLSYSHTQGEVFKNWVMMKTFGPKKDEAPRSAFLTKY